MRYSPIAKDPQKRVIYKQIVTDLVNGGIKSEVVGMSVLPKSEKREAFCLHMKQLRRFLVLGFLSLPGLVWLLSCLKVKKRKALR